MKKIDRALCGIVLASAVVPIESKATDNNRGDEKKPNLVFIFSDQQSWDMLGCYGNKQLITPNIDALAEDGVMFNYGISSCPVSCPARAMMMTGVPVLENGVMVNDIRVVTGDNTTIAEALKAEDYYTGYIGKWHLYGGDRNRAIPEGINWLGFDEFHSNNCTLNFMPEAAFYYDESGKKVKFNEWEAYGQARQAVDYIERRSKEDQPFALFVSFHPPHDQGAARNAPLRYKTIAELMNLYDPEKIKLRESTMEHPDPDQGSSFEETRADYHGYYAMCTGIDTACGWIFDALKECGVDENTLIVYTSDHGDLLKAHGRPWAKSFPEDESVRVPLIMKYPKKLEHRESDLLVGTLDLMPTMLSILDVPVPESCAGLNLEQAIVEKRDDAVESVPLFYFFPDWRGVFTKDYTYSFDLFLERDKESWNVLYDRKRDPKQMENRFYDKKYRDVRDRLHALTFEWMDKFNDPLYPCHKTLKMCGIDNLRLDKKSDDPNVGVLDCTPMEAFERNNIEVSRPKIPANDEQEAIMKERYEARIKDREAKLKEYNKTKK